MKITSKQAKAIVFEDFLDDGFESIEIGEWVSDGKYVYNKSIFSFKDKLYSLYMDRTGSHSTGWTYTHEYQDVFDCPEVKKVEVTTHKWVPVKS